MRLRSIAGSTAGSAGLVDDAGPDARFNYPDGIVLSVDKTKLYIADSNNYALRSLDLNTGEVTTLTAGLVETPHYLYIDADYFLASCYQKTAGPSTNQIYDIDPTDGSVNSQFAPATNRTGAIARFGATNEFLIKGQMFEFTNGWFKLTHDPGGTFTIGSKLQNDGAFAGEAGAISLPGGYIGYLLAYLGPSGHAAMVANSSGNTMFSGYLTSPAGAPVRQVALWDESPSYWSMIGPLLGDTHMARFHFTSSTFIDADMFDLGFSTYSMNGIAIDTDSQTMYFSGANQIWMTTLSSRWTTRALL